MHECLQVFAAEKVKKRLMDDDALVASVLMVFRENMPEQIDALGGYCSAADFNAAARQAHNIKGACANVGAEMLAEIAHQVEIAAKQEQGAQLTHLLDKLIAGQHELYAALDSYMTPNPGVSE